MTFEHLSGELVVESAVALGETTRADVGVASFQGNLCLAWTGGDHRINLMWSRDAYQFAQKQTLEHRSRVSVGSPNRSNSPAPPSLASGAGGLVLAWPSPDFVRGTVPGVMWLGGGAGHAAPVGQDNAFGTMAETPVALWGNGAVVVWLRVGNKLMMARSQGNVFGQAAELGKAYAPLSTCTIGDELVVASSTGGLKPGLSVLWSRGGAFGPPVTCPGAKAAKVCALGNELVVTWQQRRSRFIGFFRGGGLVPAVEMRTQRRFLSSEHPTLCEHDGVLVVAWPGEGGQINVARLRRT